MVNNLFLSTKILEYISLGIYIYLNLRTIFDNEFWFILERYLFGLDLGYWIEELLKFLSYEIPKETFKYVPIFFFLKYIWIKI